ncbi:MAG: MBL fold metallo-hydrolase [Acidiferrobacterales bacterium]
MTTTDYVPVLPAPSVSKEPDSYGETAVVLRHYLVSVLLFVGLPANAAESCGGAGAGVQVLGSSAQARDLVSSSYLIWLDGKARVLVDVGAGSAMNFVNSGARLADLDVILLSQLHVSHAGDLSSLIQLSLARRRSRPLPLYGPDRSKLMPSTVTFVRTLFDTKRGVYRYLGSLLSPLGKDTYKLQPHDVEIRRRSGPTVYKNERLMAVPAIVARNPIAMLAWRVEAAGKAIVFLTAANSGTGDWQTLARNADLLVISPPIDARGRNNDDLAPADTAELAETQHVGKLVLPVISRQDGRATNVRYPGVIIFAEPMRCVVP